MPTTMQQPHRQQWHSHQQRRAAQEKCGTAEPQRVALPAAHSQKDNPTQQLIKQAVDYLIQQLEAGKSETLTAYLGAMARFHLFTLATFLPSHGSARRRPE